MHITKILFQQLQQHIGQYSTAARRALIEAEKECLSAITLGEKASTSGLTPVRKAIARFLPEQVQQSNPDDVGEFEAVGAIGYRMGVNLQGNAVAKAMEQVMASGLAHLLQSNNPEALIKSVMNQANEYLADSYSDNQNTTSAAPAGPCSGCDGKGCSSCDVWG